VAYIFVTKAAGPIWAECRGGLQKLVQPGETFANGWAIVMMIIGLYAVDVTRRRGLLRIGVLVFGTGILANVFKLLFARSRPRAFFHVDADMFTGSVLDSFTGWLPLASLGYQGQSVPSGHTATAVALGIALSQRWPHGRWAFLTFVGMAVMQRLSFGHHYISDCCWGAALACAFAALCYHPKLLGSRFDRFERRLPAAGHATSKPPQAVADAA